MDADKDNVSSEEQSMNFIREQVDIVKQLVNTVEQLVKTQPSRNAVVDQMQTFKLLLDTSTATMTVAEEQCKSAKKVIKAAKQEKKNVEQLVNASESQLKIAKNLDNFAQAEMAKALEHTNTGKLPTNSVNNIVNSAKVVMDTAEKLVNIEKNANLDNLEPKVDPPEEQIYHETDPTIEVDPTEKCIDSDKQEHTEVDSRKEQVYSESGQAAEMNPAKESINSSKLEHTEIDSPKKQMYPKTGVAVDIDLTEECIVSDKQEVTEMDPPKNQIYSETCPAFEISTAEECTDSCKHKVAEMVLCQEQISVYPKIDIPVEMGPAEECAELGKQELLMKPHMNIDSPKKQMYPKTGVAVDIDLTEECIVSDKQEVIEMDPPKNQIYSETCPAFEISTAKECTDSCKHKVAEMVLCQEQISVYPKIDIPVEMGPAEECAELGKQELLMKPHMNIDSPKKQMYPKTGVAVDIDLTEECIVSDKQEVTEMDSPKNQIYSETCPAFEISTAEECTDSCKHKVAEMVLCQEQISVYPKIDIPVEMGPAEECAELGKQELLMKPHMNNCKLQENSPLVTNTEVQTPIWNPSSIGGDKNAPNQDRDNVPCTSKQSVDVSEDDVANKSISSGSQETVREAESWRSQEAMPDVQSTHKEHQSASDNACTSKIVVPYAHDRAQVWDPEVVMKLWTEHHIVGQLVGALPRKPHQNGVMGLPLSLMKEEVRLIREQNIGIPVIYKDMEQEANEKIRLEFEEQRRKCFEEQVEEARVQRKREIEMMADRILAGKRKKFEERKRKRGGEVSNTQAEISSGKKKHVVNRKLQKEVGSKEEEEAFTLTRENIIEEEVAKIRALPEDMQVVEVFTQHPLINHFRAEPYIPSSTASRRDCTKFAVFRDLWQRGYYVTQGLKFGGDFLAYPGHPQLYHACFIVRCVEDPNSVNHRDLVAATRLAATTRKTFVLAALKQESANAEVSYRSYQWDEED